MQRLPMPRLGGQAAATRLRASALAGAPPVQAKPAAPAPPWRAPTSLLPQLLDDGRAPLATPSELPLADRRIIITAPRQYAHKLGAKLVQAGARPLWVPGVAITPLPSHARGPLDEALWALIRGTHSFSHIAFTSKNGIYAVLQRLAELCAEQGSSSPEGHDNSASSASASASTSGAPGLEAAVAVLRQGSALLCALGADGDVLTRLGLPVHVSPQEPSTQGLVRELVQLRQADGAHVLCPVPLVTGSLTEPSVVPRFLEGLQRAGARAARVDAYETSQGCLPGSCEVERSALMDGQVDAIAFSSTAEAQGLLAVMAGGDRAAFAEVLTRHRVLLSAHGPTTAEGVSEVLGVPVTCISRSSRTFSGLVTAMEEAFAARAGPP